MTPPAASLAPQPLPRGRHGLAREDVRASQHARLTAATLKLIARQGYAATTVAQIAAEARVSPNRFYDFFDNKLACFVAVCDQCGTELLEEIRSVDAADWRSAVRHSTRTSLTWWRDHPEFSRAYLLELPNAGGLAHAQRAAIYERFHAMFEDVAARARAEEPGLAPFTPLAARVLVAGITDIVGEEVREGRVDRLPRLTNRLARLVIGLIVDPI
jgi:AcrR family transcriptional regulator